MFRRKNYLIKKRFQFRFLLSFVILILLESLLIGGLFMYVSSDTLTAGYLNAVLRVERTTDFFLMSFALIVSIIAVGIGIAGMVIFIMLSHRIAGPLYRFERTLDQISEGDLTTRINLRKTDQLTELKEALNTLIGSLDDHIGKIKNRLWELDELISKKEDPQLLIKITKLIESLKEEIGRFKVTPVKD